MSPPRPDPVLDDYVERLVAVAPPLTPAQRADLAVLMRPTSQSSKPPQRQTAA